MKKSTFKKIRIITRIISFFTAIITFPVGTVLTILAAGTFDYISKYNTSDPEPWGLLITGGIFLVTSLISVIIYDATWKK